jgi:hypothetical protein
VVSPRPGTTRDATQPPGPPGPRPLRGALRAPWHPRRTCAMAGPARPRRCPARLEHGPGSLPQNAQAEDRDLCRLARYTGTKTSRSLIACEHGPRSQEATENPVGCTGPPFHTTTALVQVRAGTRRTGPSGAAEEGSEVPRYPHDCFAGTEPKPQISPAHSDSSLRQRLMELAGHPTHHAPPNDQDHRHPRRFVVIQPARLSAPRPALRIRQRHQLRGLGA